MKTAAVLGKFLDQPKLISTFEKAVPAVLTLGGAGFLWHEVNKAPKEEKRKTFIKTTAVLTGTILSAIAAPKLTSKIMKKLSSAGKSHHHHNHEHVHTHSHAHEHGHEHGHSCNHNHGSFNFHDYEENIEHFIKENQLSKEVKSYLELAKEKILSPKKIKAIYEEAQKTEEGKAFLDRFIPNPHDVGYEHIFKEDIPRLSILGLFPVLGGIAGGIAGDKLTEKEWKDRIPDKIKEGSYQYLANIFLCNVGAGAALWGMKKTGINSKWARAVGMIGGIILAGIVFGSTIANAIGKIFIDPMFKHTHKGHSHGNNHLHGKDLYSERRPEALDFGLHVDDVATVAVMSGLKWIEPALPILYSISGYRAGIGYRNVKQEKS